MGPSWTFAGAAAALDSGIIIAIILAAAALSPGRARGTAPGDAPPPGTAGHEASEGCRDSASSSSLMGVRARTGRYLWSA